MKILAEEEADKAVQGEEVQEKAQAVVGNNGRAGKEGQWSTKGERVREVGGV